MIKKKAHRKATNKASSNECEEEKGFSNKIEVK